MIFIIISFVIVILIFIVIIWLHFDITILLEIDVMPRRNYKFKHTRVHLFIITNKIYKQHGNNMTRETKDLSVQCNTANANMYLTNLRSWQSYFFLLGLVRCPLRCFSIQHILCSSSPNTGFIVASGLKYILNSSSCNFFSLT